VTLVLGVPFVIPSLEPRLQLENAHGGLDVVGRVELRGARLAASYPQAM
jgi:hypothetical protein